MAWQGNGFLIGLILMMGLAWAMPEWGATGGILKSEDTRGIAIFVIFFAQGIGLPTRDLRRALIRWHPHVFALGWNYIGFPILACLGLLIFGKAMPTEIAFGLIYLAILPTSIASAVFFTSVSGGEAVIAIFSTTLSNLLAILFVPLGVAFLLLNKAEMNLWLGMMFSKLCFQIALPMLTGQGIRPFLKRMNLQPCLKRITTACLFFIMYCAFCDGVQSEVWKGLGWQSMLAACVGACALLGLGSALVWWSSGLWKREKPLRIAAFLCASQKSMATGLPMASALFHEEGASKDVPEISIIVLPLMCYHWMQLALAAQLADKFSKANAKSISTN